MQQFLNFFPDLQGQLSFLLALLKSSLGNALPVAGLYRTDSTLEPLKSQQEDDTRAVICEQIAIFLFFISNRLSRPNY